MNKNKTLLMSQDQRLTNNLNKYLIYKNNEILMMEIQHNYLHYINSILNE